MGLFGPPKYYRERTFTMPCTADEAIDVIANAKDVDGGTPFGAIIGNYLQARDNGGEISQPPLVESVYVESFSDGVITIGAGNRVKTYWRMQLALSGSNPTAGTFGALEVRTDKWFKNVWDFNSALQCAVTSVGGRTGKWPTPY